MLYTKRVVYGLFVFALIAFLSGCNQIIISGLSYPDPTNKNKHADEPFYYIGNYYYGREKGGSGTLAVRTQQLDYARISVPDVTKFKADGFFMLKGSVSSASAKDYMLLLVSKDGTDDMAKWFLQGTFESRIWLPFGKGSYTVQGVELNNVDTGNSYNGDIRQYRYSSIPFFTLHVTNTRDEDGCFLYPSCFVQSDSEELRDFALDVTRGISNPVDKVRAVHDAVCLRIIYDNASLNAGQRKKQDALTVYRTKTGVCEGYAGLTAAMLRSLGIRTKSVCGLGITGDGAGGSGLHAWNHVEVRKDGVKKWYLLDATWDDPVYIDGSEHPPRYDFFLLDLEYDESGHRQNHRQGVKDQIGTRLEDDDGKHRGQRRGRSIVADWQTPETEAELTEALSRRFPLLETTY